MPVTPEHSCCTHEEQYAATPAAQELFLELVKQQWPSARVGRIGPNTFRCNQYADNSQRVTDSWLARVVPSETGPVVIRLQGQTKPSRFRITG